MKRKKRCRWCKQIFIPNPRLGDRQITCGSERCKRQQKGLTFKLWVHRNKKDYRDALYDWRRDHKEYWRDYRLLHPEYTQRNRLQSKWRKSLLKSGLQKNLDILQLTEKQMKFWHFHRFAKEPRSIAPLLYAYTHHRKENAIIQRRIE